ncbi:DUF4097 family beta strand repeat-containing protein [Stenotrophomonas maltophilia]|uniref:DUF4097 family beta strand repeat-containing protein n=1 Tax=Stenotrophomonas maltophilia group TaxID=995085 RepID=UPI00070BFB92|nr:DUF4097 family beta strand repeat-containing protein [Stenotrophomonas maltophilia]KRG54509.1 hypothetical protein ARC02_09060 [Stenotrophomonas maltophilia]NNH49115.1 hypothetical protein [Stenotrophomonas maltophilia]VEE50969.1 Protein of uncharacterised function (DUF2807) [Stenotrophomonas maltophilia]
MRSLLACSALLLLPLSALAADAPNCKFTAARALKLDVAGARTVVFEVNQHDLKVVASAGGGQLEGRACASSQEWLDQLVLDQRKVGDKLVVSLRRDGRQSGISLGNSYAWLDIRGSVPDNLPLQFKVGSGDASVENAQSLSMDVGSGDAVARGTRGSIHAAVGSGDLNIDGGSSLNLLSLGSGDVTVRNISGDVSTGTVGSGDLKITDVRGNARLDTVGSGDIEFKRVKGSVEVGVVGSGGIDLADIGGNVHVRSHGSGDIQVDGVGGSLTVDHSGSGDVDHRNVSGKVTLPRSK